MNKAFSSPSERWRAVRSRDGQADDYFLYSVRTTGVFCRPSCAARLPRRENVAFHESVDDARSAGFRPCQRCRPDLPLRRVRDAATIETACALIESSETPPRLADLAAQVGLSAHHFHRLFKRVTGVTPGAYARARRQRQVEEQLLKGSSVTDAIYESGFNSSGRFYESAASRLGMTPTKYGRRGEGETIWYGTGKSSMGVVLVAATRRGICAILIGASKGEVVEDLKSRFAAATFRSAPVGFDSLVKTVLRLVDKPGDAARAYLPLDIRGTAFQRLVWKTLQEIPAGSTTTYSGIAEKIGRPAAVRAVAAACAANALAVAVPCHRVVGANGSLTGYRWGLERKRLLLDREKKQR